MDITRKNFHQELPRLKEAISSANFISMDCEFSGLTRDAAITPYDTPSEAYEKLLVKTPEFIVVQLGLTVFRHCETSNAMKYKSFNFYLYPRQKSQTFVAQGESLSFLSSTGFDFNKLFADGISYCTIQEEVEMRKALKKKQEEQLLKAKEEASCKINMEVPEEHVSTLKKVKKIINSFLQSDNKTQKIDGFKNVQRKFIYEMLRKDFSDTISFETKILKDGSRDIIIQRKLSPEELLVIENELKQKEENAMEDNIGLLTLMKVLSESRKLIVGHNMLMDLVYLMRQFFGEFSTDATEFKAFAHKIFPYILDTKYLATLENVKSLIKDTVLPHLFELVQNEPFGIPKIEPESPEHAYSLNAEKEHEAGYDSFITGIVLLGLTKYLSIKPSMVSNQSSVLKMHFNRIHMMRLCDVTHLSLTTKDPPIHRNYVFHVSFPDEWRLTDIQDKFKMFGNIYVTWIDSTSALVALFKREQWKTVMDVIKPTHNFRILTFSDYKSGLNKVTLPKIPAKRKSEEWSTDINCINPKKDLSKQQKKKLKKKENADFISFGPSTSAPAARVFETNDDYNI